MAYDGKLMRQALSRFEEDKERRAAAFEARKERLFRQIPRLEEIDRELRGTMSGIIASALSRGTDPMPAIRVIRDKNLDLQRERREILQAYGYSADELEEKPLCILCGDSGYRGGEVCRCLQEYYSREQIGELSQLLNMGAETFETFDFDWYSTERNGYSRTPREMAERNFDICRDYANQFSLRSGNLLLFGAPGLGKTFLSACIARVVSENGHSVVYDTAGHIFTQFESARFRREEEGDEEDVRRYLHCDLLIMDDLGTEMLTSFVQSTLYQIINGRLISGKKTIINTNLKPEQIGQRYGAQILSRIEGEFEMLLFTGEDIRRQKKNADKKRGRR